MSLLRQASRNVLRLHQPEPLYHLPPGWFQAAYAAQRPVRFRVRVLARRKR